MSRTYHRWFNTSVFQRPSGRGDIGNNCNNAKFRLPGFNNHDRSLFKNFPIREGKSFQLRWELYNTFNHTQFIAVNTTATFNAAGQQTNATFGKVTSRAPSVVCRARYDSPSDEIVSNPRRQDLQHLAPVLCLGLELTW